MALFDQHPEAWKKIEISGRTSLATMARQINSPALMDAALGYVSACRKWNRGHLPSHDAERRAARWVESHAPKVTGDSDMLVVMCPDSETTAKVRRLLAFMGCEVESL